MLASFVQSRLFDDPDSVTLVWAEGACEYNCSLVRVFIIQWHRPDDRY